MARRIVGDLDDRADVEADASGIARAVFGPVPAGNTWLYGRAVVESGSAAATTVKVYVGGDKEPPDSTDLVDGSTSGNLDVADNSSPWRVPSGKHLIVRWTGASVGARCRVHLQGVVVEMS